LAFVLGFPANEIVLPIILMAYTAQGDLQEIGELIALKDVLAAHGWTWITAVNVLLFLLMHWPCSTTVLTIRRETGNLRWTALSMVLPTMFGLVCCFLFTCVARCFL